MKIRIVKAAKYPEWYKVQIKKFWWWRDVTSIEKIDEANKIFDWMTSENLVVRETETTK